MRYVRIYADAAGVTHFEDCEFDLVEADFAPPAAPLGVSAPIPTQQTVFCRLPPGWDGSWHPTPRRQFFVLLSGRLECEVGDGATRSFGPGEFALLEDTAGRGHVTRVVGNDAVLGVFLQLPDA